VTFFSEYAKPGLSDQENMILRFIQIYQEKDELDEIKKSSMRAVRLNAASRNNIAFSRFMQDIPEEMPRLQAEIGDVTLSQSDFLAALQKRLGEDMELDPNDFRRVRQSAYLDNLLEWTVTIVNDQMRKEIPERYLMSDDDFYLGDVASVVKLVEQLTGKPVVSFDQARAILTDVVKDLLQSRAETRNASPEVQDSSQALTLRRNEILESVGLRPERGVKILEEADFMRDLAASEGGAYEGYLSNGLNGFRHIFAQTVGRYLVTVELEVSSTGTITLPRATVRDWSKTQEAKTFSDEFIIQGGFLSHHFDWASQEKAEETFNGQGRSLVRTLANLVESKGPEHAITEFFETASALELAARSELPSAIPPMTAQHEPPSASRSEVRGTDEILKLIVASANGDTSARVDLKALGFSIGSQEVSGLINQLGFDRVPSPRAIFRNGNDTNLRMEGRLLHRMLEEAIMNVRDYASKADYLITARPRREQPGITGIDLFVYDNGPGIENIPVAVQLDFTQTGIRGRGKGLTFIVDSGMSGPRGFVEIYSRGKGYQFMPGEIEPEELESPVQQGTLIRIFRGYQTGESSQNPITRAEMPPASVKPGTVEPPANESRRAEVRSDDNEELPVDEVGASVDDRLLGYLRKIVRERMKTHKRMEIANMGAARGKYAIALATWGAEVDAIEIHGPTLEEAKVRFSHLESQVQKRIRPILSDLFAQVPGDRKYDLVTFYPPLFNERKPSPREDRRRILEDPGFKLVSRFLEQAPNYLKPGGKVILAYGYADEVEEDGHINRGGMETLVRESKGAWDVKRVRGNPAFDYGIYELALKARAEVRQKKRNLFQRFFNEENIPILTFAAMAMAVMMAAKAVSLRFVQPAQATMLSQTMPVDIGRAPPISGNEPPQELFEAIEMPSPQIPQQMKLPFLLPQVLPEPLRESTLAGPSGLGATFVDLSIAASNQDRVYSASLLVAETLAGRSLEKRNQIVYMLMDIAAHESMQFKKTRQGGHGPARGFFQNEPWAATDLFLRMISNEPDWTRSLLENLYQPEEVSASWNTLSSWASQYQDKSRELNQMASKRYPKGTPHVQRKRGQFIFSELKKYLNREVVPNFSFELDYRSDLAPRLIQHQKIRNRDVLFSERLEFDEMMGALLAAERVGIDNLDLDLEGRASLWGEKYQTEQDPVKVSRFIEDARPTEEWLRKKLAESKTLFGRRDQIARSESRATTKISKVRGFRKPEKPDIIDRTEIGFNQNNGYVELKAFHKNGGVIAQIAFHRPFNQAQWAKIVETENEGYHFTHEKLKELDVLIEGQWDKATYRFAAWVDGRYQKEGVASYLAYLLLNEMPEGKALKYLIPIKLTESAKGLFRSLEALGMVRFKKLVNLEVPLSDETTQKDLIPLYVYEVTRHDRAEESPDPTDLGTPLPLILSETRAEVRDQDSELRLLELVNRLDQNLAKIQTQIPSDQKALAQFRKLLTDKIKNQSVRPDISFLTFFSHSGNLEPWHEVFNLLLRLYAEGYFGEEFQTDLERYLRNTLTDFYRNPVSIGLHEESQAGSIEELQKLIEHILDFYTAHKQVVDSAISEEANGFIDTTQEQQYHPLILETQNVLEAALTYHQAHVEAHSDVIHRTAPAYSAEIFDYLPVEKAAAVLAPAIQGLEGRYQKLLQGYEGNLMSHRHVFGVLNFYQGNGLYPDYVNIALAPGLYEKQGARNQLSHMILAEKAGISTQTDNMLGYAEFSIALKPQLVIRLRPDLSSASGIDQTPDEVLRNQLIMTAKLLLDTLGQAGDSQGESLYTEAELAEAHVLVDFDSRLRVENIFEESEKDILVESKTLPNQKKETALRLNALAVLPIYKGVG
ncbi:MAG: hypothetical protein HY351_02020, partial [Candidatus Omnitrophica bacterium]|nr:hypothetical protein [Candidatus Omnitrophota bacterium]